MPYASDHQVSVNLIELAARVAALPSSADAKVVWFLDIDGVINLDPSSADKTVRHGGEWPRYSQKDVPAGQGLAFPITWAPALVDLLNALHRKKVVSFRWLTTWEHAAHRHFAPAVGLDLGTWVAGGDDGTSGSWWKLDVIAENLHHATNLVIWTDDDIDSFPLARKVVEMLRPDDSIAMCTNPHTGLTPSNLAYLLDAIERAVG